MILVVAATLVSGFLAGGNLERAIVTMPAWEQLGADTWAAFSRRADLGAGLILYPLEALLGAALILSAAISHALERPHQPAVAWSLGCGVICTVAGLALTVKAAPLMLSLRHDPMPTGLPRIFQQFRDWGDIRAAFQIAAFLAELCALFALAVGHQRAAERTASGPGLPPATKESE